MDYRIRPATEADAAAICQIYNQGIEDRLATLETELRTADERRQWLKSRSPRHPVIVAERAEPVTASNRPPTPLPDHAAPATTIPATTIAWASLNVFNARDAYRFVADISVYVERQWRGKGAGRVLLTRLIELGREHEYHKLVLSAFPFNPGGMTLYDKLGFRTVGIYKEQGQLDGAWVDTIIMERLL
jgi:phosphinothricin acetyltransferase